LALLAVAMVGLRGERRTWLTTTATIGGVVGAVAMARVVVVDILVAWGAADRAERDRNYAKYEFAGSDVLDEAGGILFPLGLVVLLVVTGTARSPVAASRP
jgi:hypothetical protein